MGVLHYAVNHAAKSSCRAPVTPPGRLDGKPFQACLLPPRPILTSHLTNFMHAGFSGTRPFNVEARKTFLPQTGVLGLNISPADRSARS